MLCWIFLVIGIISTCVFIYKRDSNSSHLALLLKTSSSMMFIITSVCAIYYNKGDIRYGILIALGLTFCMLGDIWLDLKWIYPKDVRYFLYGGFIFFMLGHICFTSAMVLANGLPRETFLKCLIPAAIFGVGIQLFAKPLKLDLTGNRFIVSMYSAFLTMSVSTSITLAVINKGECSQLLLAVGTVLFFLSDLVLSNTYFGEGKTSKPYIVLNHILYYSGQFLIAMSVAFFK